MDSLITFFKGFGLQRGITHLLLAAATVMGVYLTTHYVPHAGAPYILTIACGYICLLLLSVTLLIGPLNLLRKRLNPVNIDLRRDVGIWAGINGCLHVVFALIEHNRGGILAFFFRFDGRPLLNLTGISNYLGLIATIILIALLATSNMMALRQLKGKRWKKLQQLNYLLTALVFMHTFAYQIAGGREKPFVDVTAIAVVVVLLIQLIGVNVYQQRSAAHLIHR
jgi:methionine sulfoxide reductase heme-binding subunit